MSARKPKAPPTGRDAIPYAPKNKGYYKDPVTDARWTRVTTILDNGVPKKAIPFWAANISTQSALDNLPWLVSQSRSAAGMQEAYDYIRRAHTRKKDERADIGNAVHSMIEERVLGTPIPDEVRDDPEMAPYRRHFERFVAEWEIEFTASEMVVANPADGWCGTLDYLLRSPKVVDAVNRFRAPKGQLLVTEVWGLSPLDPAMEMGGDSKGLALDTPLPTPTGWTTMGAVQVGDQLLGSDGKPCTVTQVSEVHERDCYRVSFDDTSSVVCDDEHLWLTMSGAQKQREMVLSTTEIRSTLMQYRQKQHRVLLPSALDLPEKSLPIDPYVLGVWLGDGKHTSGEICNPDDEIFDHVEHAGYKVGPPQKLTTDRACPVRTILGLVTSLRSSGLIGQKHIPDEYLRASYSQRLALVQGLMDTDGGWNRARNSVQFVSVDKAFASSVRELVLSLGQRVLMSEATHVGFKPGVHYVLTFTPRAGLNPFRLSRKADLVKVPSDVRSSRRVITSVEPTLTVPTKCIAVDSPDRTYLCTEWMIPTHNTGGELDVKGIYDSVGLQLSAYGHAQYCWLRDGTRLDMPPISPVGVALHLRPEGYRLIPVRCDDAMYQVFRHAQAVAEWSMTLAKTVTGGTNWSSKEGLASAALQLPTATPQSQKEAS